MSNLLIEDSNALAARIMEVARNRHLPPAYRHRLAQRARAMFENNVGSDDARLLPVLKVIAHTSDESSKEAAFRDLLALQEKHPGGSPRELVGTLANIGRLLVDNKQFAEAEPLYRRAHELSGNLFMASQLAVCLAARGQFQEAYELTKQFPDCYFSVMEQEFSEYREECQEEWYGEHEHD